VALNGFTAVLMVNGVKGISDLIVEAELQHNITNHLVFTRL